MHPFVLRLTSAVSILLVTLASTGALGAQATTDAGARAPVAAARASAPRTANSFSAERLARVDRFLQQYVDSNLIGGAVALVLRNGQVAYTKSVGWIDRESRRPMTPDAIFRIASQSKAITSTAILILVEEGRIALSDPVSRFIPAFAHTTVASSADSGRTVVAARRPITIQDLLTHTAGISYGGERWIADRYAAKGLGPAAGNGWYTADKTEPVCETMERLATLPFVAQPGESFVYGYNTDILGCVVERASGIALDEFIRTRITGPLGMSDTRITLTADERARLAPGHDVGGDTTANWELDALAGAGALRSTADDLLDYLAAAMRGDSATAVGRALRFAELPRRSAGAPVTQIGLAWNARIVDGDTIVWHNGATGGYHSLLGFDAARGVGLVVLSNSAVPYDDVALHLLDPAVPISPPAVPPHRDAVTLTAAQLAPYVGRYQLAPQVVLEVTRDGTQLYAQLTGQQPIPMYAERDGRFFLRVVDAVLDFERDGEGRVAAVVLHQNGRDARAPRLP